MSGWGEGTYAIHIIMKMYAWEHLLLSGEMPMHEVLIDVMLVWPWEKKSGKCVHACMFPSIEQHFQDYESTALLSQAGPADVVHGCYSERVNTIILSTCTGKVMSIHAKKNLAEVILVAAE